MFSITQSAHKFISFSLISRSLCSNTNAFIDGFQRIEKHLLANQSPSNPNFDETLEHNSLDFVTTSDRYEDHEDHKDHDDLHQHNIFTRARFIRAAKQNAVTALHILQQDGPGFDTKSALDSLNLEVSRLFVREVLIGILKNITHVNRDRCAKLGYKFFVWAGEKQSYKHTVNAYHLIMQILAQSEEYKAMWRLVDEMTEKGHPVTSRTFNILICTCGEAGVAKKVVERFIKSKSFNFRPYSHCFNAILHSLLAVKQYELIEWAYQRMLTDRYKPDLLTYNIVMYAKYRLGKLGQFRRLLDEMIESGFPLDVHTFNILLHVLGKGDKPADAVNLLTDMKKVGIEPNVLHFTTLIDGLSRAGNMEACKHFFDEMVKYGCEPDVVAYTVMITGYIAVGQLEKAEEMFSEMFNKGKIPNVYTYNSMIRGRCMAGKFEYACSMLKEMEFRGCNPNFLVYSTLVSNLRKAGKFSEANEVIKHMVEKGQYTHLLHKIWRYQRC
ncbi:hypothetical protein QVD17_08266 [Tagetes erecta]|uniref:Pentatricopeptide repeat-containing protein n=1 Tax=Tagetes erecta TaxID=13708 RepID=A0AAD8KXW1_TARER|nr:hypothetical protein QVD17_08266 [Tagetes erecta]